MADWTHETWRRIYRTPDPKWLALRASTRALAAELLRWVDDDGRVVCRPGEAPWQAVARVIQADRTEFGWVRKGLDELAADGHLVVSTGLISIRNFRVAQGITESPEERAARRTREAEKKARQRQAKRQNLEDSRSSGSDAPAPVPLMSPGDNRGDNTGDTAPCPPSGPEGCPEGTLARAHAGEHAQARAPGRAGAFPSVPLPVDHKHSAGALRDGLRPEAQLVVDAVVGAEDLFPPASLPDTTRDYAKRIGDALAAMAPELRWRDLDAEVDGWVTYVRQQAVKGRDKGEPWGAERALAELESRAKNRIRWRPEDARKERDRRRRDATPPRSFRAVEDDDDFEPLLAPRLDP